MPDDKDIDVDVDAMIACGRELHQLFPNDLNPDGTPIWRRVDPHAPRDPGHVSAERKAISDREHAEAFVQKLLKAVPVDQRLGMVAPTALVDPRGCTRSVGWEPRYPTITEAHEPWLDIPERKFMDVAASMGRSHEYSTRIKAQLKIIYLYNGQVPPFAGSIADSRKPAEDYEGVYGAVLTSQIWPIHEDALVIALERGMRRTIPAVMSRYAELLCKLFTALTVLKVGPTSIVPIRGYLRALTEVVAACRAEFQQ